jgi:hypothetical protein
VCRYCGPRLRATSTTTTTATIVAMMIHSIIPGIPNASAFGMWRPFTPASHAPCFAGVCDCGGLYRPIPRGRQSTAGPTVEG